MEVKETKSRTQNKSKKRRRSRARAVVFAISFLIVCTLVLWVLAYTVLFPIKHITVSGNRTYTSEMVIEQSKIELGDKLYSVSRSKTEQNLSSKLPYIKTVDFKRSIINDSTLEIIVEETVDAFCYNIDNKFVTTDYDNKALAEFSAKPDNTALITINKKINYKLGEIVSIDEKIWSEILKIYDKLTKNDITVNAIDMSNMNNIKVTINKQFTVEFGTTAYLDGKVSHLCSMVDEIILKNGESTKGVIDLTAWSSKNQRGYYEPKNIF